MKLLYINMSFVKGCTEPKKFDLIIFTSAKEVMFSSFVCLFVC